MTRAELVAAAEQSIRNGSKSFRAASRLFDRETRERAWLLYCWCRYCDDQCDGQECGQGNVMRERSVAELEKLTLQALDGETTGVLPFDALAALLRERPIPRRFMLEHLSGFALDASGWRPGTEADLLRYCYLVAGVVGCMMAVVMGVGPEDKEILARAADLGIAFQLSNIARDVREDHEAGRCYIPADLAAENGLDLADPMRRDQRDRLVAVVRRLVTLAEQYEVSARAGVWRLPFRSRWAVLAAARIYGGIGRRVAELGPGAWDERVVVRRRRKLAFLAPTLIESAFVREAR